MAVLDGSLTQAPNDHLCLFSHMVSAFLELRQFASQLAWRSRRSKRFSILDNAVILHQLHHVHTQQQDSPFTSSPVLLFSFFHELNPRHGRCSWTLWLSCCCTARSSSSNMSPPSRHTTDLYGKRSYLLIFTRRMAFCGCFFLHFCCSVCSSSYKYPLAFYATAPRRSSVAGKL